MTYSPNPAGYTWNDSLAKLQGIFDTWGVRNRWEWECSMSNQAFRGRSHWSEFIGTPKDRAVTVRFIHPKNGERSLAVSKFECPRDNLWALAKGLDEIRLNEKRGLDDVAREFYKALPAPATAAPKRDPWAVLQLAPNAPRSVIDAAYRAQAKTLHPDAGGSAEAMAELNEAYEAVKGTAS